MRKGFEYSKFKYLFSHKLRLNLSQFRHKINSKFLNSNIAISQELDPSDKNLEEDEWNVGSRLITKREGGQVDEEGYLHYFYAI